MEGALPSAEDQGECTLAIDGPGEGSLATDGAKDSSAANNKKMIQEHYAPKKQSS